MTCIAIYGFTGRYVGDSKYDWNHPEVGAIHKCMLFLRQESESDEFKSAESECEKYGFSDLKKMRFGLLKIEVLNTDNFRGFAGFYEEALQEGSALVYYPNKDTNGGDAA